MWVNPALGKVSVSEAKYPVFILFWRNIVSSDNKYLKVAETFVFRNFWAWLSLLQQLRFIEPWLYFRYYVGWVLYLTCGSAVQFTMMDSKPSPALKANCRPVGVVAAFVHVCVCAHTHILFLGGDTRTVVTAPQLREAGAWVRRETQCHFTPFSMIKVFYHKHKLCLLLYTCM